MKLTLGFSPCPNDTFIFDALIHHKVDTEGLTFEVQYEDVETLNQKAFRDELDITKLSYHAYAYAVEKYVLLDSGSALGFGVGPLLITKNPELAEKLGETTEARRPKTPACRRQGRPETGVRNHDIGDPTPNTQYPIPNTQVSHLKTGIPGKYTTANFLLSLAFPELTNKKELVFSDIEQSLLAGELDLGLIIHENRFTYQDKGLYKVMDLGDFWEKETGFPIPLGGIVARRDLPKDVIERINRVLRKSVAYAFLNPKSGIDFIRSHAQEMEEAVMYKHIELYVNQYSLELGEEGRAAVKTLFDKAYELGIIPKSEKQLFHA